MNLRAEPYLATLLAGANAMVDLNGFAAERTSRLGDRFGLSLPSWTTFSVGELAAISWAVESLTSAETKASFSDRVLLLDFDVLLAGWIAGLAAVFDKFGIPVPNGFLAGIEKSAVMTRYSKAPEQYAYSRRCGRNCWTKRGVITPSSSRRVCVSWKGWRSRSSRVAAIL